MRVNLAYLLSIDLDRLLYSVRSYAGLSTRSAKPYGGWEAPTWGSRGHFIGHYLSAVSKAAKSMAALDPEAARGLAARRDRLVADLHQCQQAIGRLQGEDAPGRFGYLNTQSTAQFDRLEALKPCDVPYYQIHKFMAGLLDAYLIGGNRQALSVATGMANYFAWRMSRLDAARIAAMTETRRYQGQTPRFFMEFGAMQDVCLLLWRQTGNPAHRRLAACFDRPWFLSMLAEDRDELGRNAQHANTEIANVMGLARHHETTGAPAYRDATLNFLRWMREGHEFANGSVSGTSDYPAPLDYGAELFGTPGLTFRQASVAPSARGVGSVSSAGHRECGESCCSHNLNRVTAYALRVTGDARWGDAYERRYVNAVLAQQHPASGMLVYNLNLAPGSVKKFGTAEDSFWCCYGSGVEAYAELPENAFLHRGAEALYVVNYVPGTLDWRAAGVRVTQETRFPADGRIGLRMAMPAPRRFALHVRIPAWASGAAVRVNDRAVSKVVTPGAFLPITRVWRDGDRVEIDLPFALRAEPMTDRADMVSLHHGPNFLVGCADGEVTFTGASDALLRALRPAAEPGSFDLTGASPVRFRPLHRVVDHRYAGYTRLIGEPEQRLLDELTIGDAHSQALHRLTTNRVRFGQAHGEAWIEGDEAIDMTLAVDPVRKTFLTCRYWGGDAGDATFARLFDIVLPDAGAVVVATQSLAREAPGKWHDVTYPLPPELTKNRKRVTIRFLAKGFERVPGRAGRLFSHVRTFRLA
ncbi:glycoside hydrolase family 127 protein [Sphingomonas sp. RRHST34]|uniref:Glycoside hydrolase family 127 protein n=2 Tax=Sphingomonas citri TaxID=2862499 RepID=A0ABS7BSD8_9SPHN|nr:glycoside hydrolase family 127 protein [Sphingomonas citri]